MRWHILADRTQYHKCERSVRRMLLDTRGELQAIHLGHMHIEDGETIRLVVRTRAKQIERIGAAVSNVASHPPTAQLLQEDFPVGRVIVHNERRQADQIPLLQRLIVERVTRLLEARREPEGGTHAHLADHAYFP